MLTLLEFMNRDRLRNYKKYKKHKAKPIYKYFPANENEFIEIVKQLVKERGWKADLNDIDTSKIRYMSGLFNIYNGLSEFNGDISKWDVSNVESMSHMFYNSSFDGDISDWNVERVENMNGMFMNSKFDGDISDWNVEKVENMESMFCGSGFDGDIDNWKVNPSCDMTNIFKGCPLSKNPPKWYKK